MRPRFRRERAVGLGQIDDARRFIGEAVSTIEATNET
jgi:hypothetical protein